MSEGPYNPCDEDSDWIIQAKEWELLRRNPEFRARFSMICKDRASDIEPERSLVTQGFRLAYFVLAFASRSVGSNDRFSDEPFLLDLSFNDAFRRLGEWFFLSVIFLSPWDLYALLPDSDTAKSRGFSYVKRGIPIFIGERPPCGPESDHHVLLVPKRTPSVGHRNAICETIERLIETDGPSKRSFEAGGSYLGSPKQWEAFLWYEHFEREQIPYVKSIEEENVTSALEAVYPGKKNHRNYRGVFNKNRKAILQLIEAAYPA